MPFGNTTSSAAGAYQVLHKTWKGLKEERLAYGITSFSEINQDIFGIVLLKHKVYGTKKYKYQGEWHKGDVFKDASTGKALNAFTLILENRIEDAIKISSLEWASLPPARYGQPITSLDEAIKDYKKYLKEELSSNTSLNISNETIKELFL